MLLSCELWYYTNAYLRSPGEGLLGIVFFILCFLFWSCPHISVAPTVIVFFHVRGSLQWGSDVLIFFSLPEGNSIWSFARVLPSSRICTNRQFLPQMHIRVVTVRPCFPLFVFENFAQTRLQPPNLKNAPRGVFFPYSLLLCPHSFFSLPWIPSLVILAPRFFGLLLYCPSLSPFWVWALWPPITPHCFVFGKMLLPVGPTSLCMTSPPYNLSCIMSTESTNLASKSLKFLH